MCFEDLPATAVVVISYTFTATANNNSDADATDDCDEEWAVRTSVLWEGSNLERCSFESVLSENFKLILENFYSRDFCC